MTPQLVKERHRVKWDIREHGLMGPFFEIYFFTVRCRKIFNLFNSFSFLQDVEPSSPAALAGLQPHSDFIVGADQLLQDVSYYSLSLTLHLIGRVCS